MVGVDGLLTVDTIKKQEMYVVPYPNLHEYFQNRDVTSLARMTRCFLVRFSVV